MPECKYCNKHFEKTRSDQVYCPVCRKDGRRLRSYTVQTPEQTAQKQRRKDAKLEARVRASLNCKCYQGCLRAFKLPCWKCTKKIYKEDAWKHEPGVLIYNGVD